jgi:hypothetical protein
MKKRFTQTFGEEEMTPNSSLLYRAGTITSRGCSRSMVAVIAALCIWIWFAGAFASAQSDRGSVSGIVTDPSGAGITGAKITITNTAMGTQNSTVATGAGQYTVPELAAGIYSVTVVAPVLPRWSATESRFRLERRHMSTCNWV